MPTILIVDDHAANRKLLVAMLRLDGHRLLEAADGRAALAVVQTEHPDLVITDVLMPVMDGYEFVRQLRFDPRTCGIPVVFCTAHYGEREAKALALSSGVAYVLTKPVENDEVLRIVRGALAGDSETGLPSPAAPLGKAFDREHLRLVTDKLSEKAGDLKTANQRLKALINIGLELASERDSERLLHTVCASARDLFGATYVTLGILNRHERTVQRFIAHGTDVPHWIKPGDEVPGFLRALVDDRRTLRGDNPDGEPSRLQLPVLHPEIQAFLAAPIVSPAQIYGWICLVGNDGRSFTDDDEQLLMALAGQVGRIYENGYFYAMAEKRANELEHEILERQKAESVGRDKRERAQRYLDTAEIILLALDKEGKITLVNRKGCDLLGWTAHELLGRDWIETCVPARIRDVASDAFHNVLGGDLSIVEHLVSARSGEERLIEWRNTVLRDDAGQVTGTLSSGADITTRTQAVEALRTADERMRFALQSANVGIWDMDYTSGVLRWSETSEAQYGLRPGTFGGTFAAFVACIHPEDRASVLETVGDAMKAGTDFSTQYRAVRPDGTVRWLSGAGRILVGERGEPVRGVGISLDVTERRALEDQYLQAQKMEAIGRLAGGVAHDFNNLLTAILGYCELLLEDLDPDLPQRADISEIQKAGMSAAGLTRQLLAFSRKQIIEPTRLDLNEVVADLRAMLGRLIGEDVKILLGLRPGLSPVIADRGQIEQIVMNLAVNARDAMPKGGTMTIETANVELDEHYAATHLAVTPGPYVALTVTDTGTGMTPDVQARLFEPFFTTKEVGKGTGLGLATVHGIVTRGGGTINVYSEIGRGTSFKAYFPRAGRDEMVVDAAPLVVHLRGGAETVLVVDDSPAPRELARRLLERQGYTVLIAAGAEEALQRFAEHPSIDLILTDVVMPDASGPELARQLVQQRPGLKMIYMSGYTEEAIVHHGVLNPGIAFLHKPFTADTLGRKIREALDRTVAA